jgi:hypothetical protein
MCDRRDVDVGDRPMFGFGVAATGGQQSQEVRFPRTVRSEYGDPIPVMDFEVERQHEVGEFELIGDDRDLSRASAAQTHSEVLLTRNGLGRAGGLEAFETSLCGAVPRGHVRVIGGLLFVHLDKRPQFRVFLVPSFAQLLESFESVRSGRVISAESSRVHPCCVARRGEFDSDDLRGRLSEQLAIVGHEEDALVRVLELGFEPALSRDVKEVVGLVKDEDVIGPAQKRLEHELLLLPSRQGGDLTVPASVEGQAQRRGGAGVPEHLRIVSAHVRPIVDRCGVGHLHCRRFAVGSEQTLLGSTQMSGRHDGCASGPALRALRRRYRR